MDKVPHAMTFAHLLGFLPYLAPAFVGAYRDHPRKTAIFVLNLFLGWTVIGWIAALVWALSGDRGEQPIEASGDERTPDGLKLQGGDPRPRS